MSELEWAEFELALIFKSFLKDIAQMKPNKKSNEKKQQSFSRKEKEIQNMLYLFNPRNF